MRAFGSVGEVGPSFLSWERGPAIASDHEASERP